MWVMHGLWIAIKRTKNGVKNNMTKIITNLGIIHKNDQVLLGMKKRGFGAGRWNGYGGKVLEGENIEDALCREVAEEAGIELTNVAKHGVIDFELQDTGDVFEVNIYKISDYKGEPKETEEMLPQWFKIEELPFDKMWPTDVHWIPLLLEGKKFKGGVILDKQSSAEYASKVISKNIFVVENI